jgi:hypothetical protein
MHDLREVDELNEIVAAFASPPSSIALSKLRQLTQGSLNPDDDTTTAARDTQYELFLYAILSNSGLVVELGEPDLLVSSKSGTFPIEAKRPGLASRVDERLHAAVKQVRARQQTGIVALSLDQVIRPRGQYMSVATPEIIADAVSLEVEKFVQGRRAALWRRSVRGPIAGIIFTAVVPGKTTATGMLVTGRSIRFEVLPDAAPAAKAIVMEVHGAISKYMKRSGPNAA